MQLSITIGLDNAAFDDNQGPETARILLGVAEWAETWIREPKPGDCQVCRDINGNRVGTAKIVEN